MEGLAVHIVPVLAGLILYFVVKTAFKWADAGWGAILLMFIAWAIVQVARLIFVPTLDAAYVSFRQQVGDSQLGADAARLLAAAPEDLGFSGEGARIFVDGEPVTTTLITAEEEPVVVVMTPAVPSPQVSVAVSDMTFPAAPVELRGDTLTIFRSSGTAEVISASQITIAVSCGFALSDYDWSLMTPRTLMTCPPEAGDSFLAAEVYLPAGFPRPSESLRPQIQPTLVPAPALSVADQNQAIGQCWLKTMAKIGLDDVTEGIGTDLLPIGTTWKLRGPAGFADFGSWTWAANERWWLSSAELGIQDYQINGHLGRSFPGADDSGTIVVNGTGNFCQPGQ